MKDLIEKHQTTKASNPTGITEVAELLINEHKANKIRSNSTKRIKNTLKNRDSLKGARRKPGIGKNQMYALKDKRAISLLIWIRSPPDLEHVGILEGC